MNDGNGQTRLKLSFLYSERLSENKPRGGDDWVVRSLDHWWEGPGFETTVKPVTESVRREVANSLQFQAINYQHSNLLLRLDKLTKRGVRYRGDNWAYTQNMHNYTILKWKADEHPLISTNSCRDAVMKDFICQQFRITNLTTVPCETGAGVHLPSSYHNFVFSTLCEFKFRIADTSI